MRAESFHLELGNEGTRESWKQCKQWKQCKEEVVFNRQSIERPNIMKNLFQINSKTT